MKKKTTTLARKATGVPKKSAMLVPREVLPSLTSYVVQAKVGTRAWFFVRCHDSRVAAVEHADEMGTTARVVKETTRRAVIYTSGNARTASKRKTRGRRDNAK